jgi:hypothetical protein
MALTKVLIAVKTYPTLSAKYDELVCTAGFREDGTWIRVYPVPFRKLEYASQYKKYDWIELELVKNTSDFRPESFRPKSIDTEIKVVGHVSPDNNWRERKEIVLNNVYTNLEKLKKEAKDKKIKTSLAVFKPTKVLNFTCKSVSREWSKEKLLHLQQGNLFEKKGNSFEVVRKIPYKFSYTIVDDAGTQSTMMIEDWEIGALYWRQLAKHEDNEAKACADVEKKYFADFAKTKDLYLLLGTTKVNHFVAPNPFIIIGTFHPPVVRQTSLF